jgi:hypothetical protein
MEDEYEEILAQLTQPQIQTLVAAAKAYPYNTTENDLETFLRLGLFKRPRIDPGHETYTAYRESRAGYGHPVLSDFGREWVEWYQSRRP